MIKSSVMNVSASRFFCRDNTLCSLLDGVRGGGNGDVHVRSAPTDRGLRLTPYYAAVDQDTESQLVRHLLGTPAAG